jgi:hypothetical protein
MTLWAGRRHTITDRIGRVRAMLIGSDGYKTMRLRLFQKGGSRCDSSWSIVLGGS